MKKLLTLLFPLLLVAGACSDAGAGDASESADTTTTSAEGSTAESEAESSDDEPITVLVTNDDGVGAEGLCALVEALDARDDVEVVVVAPAENASATGGKTTGGQLQATQATTASGYEATAVGGFPADAVIYALEQEGLEPDLVISGINDGQNIAQVVNISGTVGAARQAAQLGVPALATSQGFGDPPDFPTAVELVMDWLDDNIAAIRDGSLGSDTISSLNVPTCPQGSIQGLVEVPVSSTEGDINAVDCAGTAEPTDDLTAFTNGWAALTVLEPTGSITEDG